MIHRTRVSDHSSTIIDNVFSNIRNLNTNSGNILAQVADHFPQLLVIRKAGVASKTQSYHHDFSAFGHRMFFSRHNVNFEYLNDPGTP